MDTDLGFLRQSPLVVPAFEVMDLVLRDVSKWVTIFSIPEKLGQSFTVGQTWANTSRTLMFELGDPRHWRNRVFGGLLCMFLGFEDKD